VSEEHKGLDDPRAVEILTAEHWSLLSSRSLGYQEMFSRATIFVSILSGTVVALAFLAQATRFRRETLWIAAFLIGVDLFIGVATFARSVVINLHDIRWVKGMSLLRHAYTKIVPEVEPFFVTEQHPEADPGALAHGSAQHMSNLGNSLTTTSSTIATLNSLLAGALASDVSILGGISIVWSVSIGVITSIASGWGHVTYAARFRQKHTPSS
jgi:hypothetical protein